MTGRKLKLLGDDRREQQQYIDSGAETLTSAAGYFSGRIQELGEKVECRQGHMDVERELRNLRVLADCILLDVRGRCGEQRYQSALNNLHDRLDWGLSPAWAESCPSSGFAATSRSTSGSCRALSWLPCLGGAGASLASLGGTLSSARMAFVVRSA